MGGWVKLHRDILSWEWWDEPAMVKAWLTILMLANSEDRKWHGQTVKAGSFVTSLGKLSASLGLPINRTRTVISRLKETGEITVQSNRHFTLVSVNNWEKYQDNDQTNDEENHKPQSADNQADNADFSEKVTNQSQTNHKPITDKSQTNHNKQEIKEYRETNVSLSAGADAPTRVRESVLPFDEFWEMYGKKVDRKASETAYARIPERERAKIKEHVPRYVAATPEVRYRKNPATYLHNQSWNNEIITAETHQQSTVLHEYGFAPNESGTEKQPWEVDLNEIE